MTLLLAVEPDSKQSAILKDIARRQLDANLLVVRSTEEAVAAIDKRLPDLILMSALVPPRDEAALNEHLRAMDGADRVQTVSIPLLAHSSQKRAARGKRFDTFRRKSAAAECGCDPAVFGSEIAAYLKQAAELRPTTIEETAAVEDAGLKSCATDVGDDDIPAAVPVVVTQDPSPAVPVFVAQDFSPASVEETATVIEATSHVPLPPPIADDVFREILEEMPLPWLGRGVVPDADEGPAATPDLYHELSRRRDSSRGTRSTRRMQIIPAPASDTSLSEAPKARMELWHALPMLLHVPPSLQGPDIDERRRTVVVASPIAATPAPVVIEAPAIASIVREPVVPAAAVAVSAPAAQPDEWGLYNPSACGFEALFEKLDQIDHGARDTGHGARDTGHGIRDTVTDEILQSLRLPPSIAALSAPRGARVKRIRKPKRPHTRAPIGQRSPEPLIIVSRRMLELG